VQRDEASGEDDGSYYDGGREEEPYDPQENERARHTGGGGVSARSVGLALTISGLVVGLTGAAVGIAGTAAEDKTTTIVGAFIGLGGGALSVTGLIINLTASGGGSGGRRAGDGRGDRPGLGLALRLVLSRALACGSERAPVDSELRRRNERKGQRLLRSAALVGDEAVYGDAPRSLVSRPLTGRSCRSTGCARNAGRASAMATDRWYMRQARLSPVVTPWW
jgi:hypothetical protein